MKTVGEMVDNVAKIAVTSASMTERARIMEMLQSSYYELCEKTSWAVLRETASLAFSSATTSIWLPSDLIGIDAVVGDANSGYRQYLSRDESDVGYQETNYRYYFSDIAFIPVAQGDDLQLTTGATTFTAAGLTTNYTDSYISFGTKPGFYKLTAIKTIERPYYGVNLSDEHWQIRPPGTKKITAVDPARETTTETLTCYYWRYPPPLFRETDIIIIPAERALELMTAIRYIGERHKQTFKSNQFIRELHGGDGDDGELAKAIKANPIFNPPSMPQDIQGNIFDMGKNTYARRSGVSSDNKPGGTAWMGYFRNT